MDPGLNIHLRVVLSDTWNETPVTSGSPGPLQTGPSRAAAYLPLVSPPRSSLRSLAVDNSLGAGFDGMERDGVN